MEQMATLSREKEEQATQLAKFQERVTQMEVILHALPPNTHAMETLMGVYVFETLAMTRPIS